MNSRLIVRHMRAPRCFALAAALLAGGCAQILGIEDLPSGDAGPGPSGDAGPGPSLASVVVDGVAPAISLVPGTTEYQVELPLLQQSVTLTAAVATPGDTLTIAGTTVASGTPSAPIAPWDEGPWAGQTSEAIWKAFEKQSLESGTVNKQTGDTLAALQSAERIIEATYTVPFVAHATMDPMVCIADVRADGCEVWAPTQSPQEAQKRAAKALDLPVEKVTVHVLMSGSAFGRRLESDFVEDAVRVSKAVGKPAKIVWTRADDMKHDWFRPATYNVLKGGFDRSGNVLAWAHRIVGPNSRGLVVGGSTPPYDFPTLLVDFHLIDTGVRLGAWRSVGPSQNAFVIESFISTSLCTPRGRIRSNSAANT